MKLTVDIALTPRQLAIAFADMGDEEQAQVFIEVADIARTWTGTTFAQWFSVGRHLRDCGCSTDDARELVLEIAKGIGP